MFMSASQTETSARPVFSAQAFADRVVLITGGASGIGLACARAFAECGAMLAIADLPSSDGEAVARSLREALLPATGLVLVGQRAPVDDLYTALRYGADGLHADLPFTLTRIGDCEAPAIIAAATYAGHRYAQLLDRAVDIDLPLQHDKVDVGLVAPLHWARAAE
jgi:NAD(P)-dependent dehydrogenase (short-subunit alcohol dehydrogenase family)